MLNIFKRVRLAGPPCVTAAAAEAAMQPVPRYPPVDPGLPAVAVDAIVASQSHLIDRLRTIVAGDAALFDRWYLMPIRAVAQHVHLLPASCSEHFAGPGGLFRLCLEIAVFARQAADAQVFTTSAGAEVRHALEPRWRYAAFLSGLLCELPGPLSNAVVTLPTGQTWPAHLGSLSGWLADQSAGRYHVCWRPGACASVGRARVAASVATWVPTDALVWLDSGPATLSGALLAIVLAETSRDALRTPLARLIEATRVRVLDGDAATRRTRYGRVRFGHHLELHLLDAMRHAVASGQWRTDAAGPLTWQGEALYLEWPGAADAVRSLAQANGIHGIPRAATTLAEVLGDAGVVLAADSPDGGWLWTINDGERRTQRTALRFADARCILSGLEPAEKPVAVASLAPRRQPRDRTIASPAAPNRPTCLPAGLSDDEHRWALQWQQALADQRTDLAALLPGPCLAVSQDLLTCDGDDLARVASALDRRGWLGRGDWPAPNAKAGLLNFTGQRKPGLVVNADGLRAMRLLGS